jgi:hypothetical protein
MNRWMIIPIALALGAIALGPPVQAQTWTITTIDSGGDVGRCSDVQIDASGDLHVCYLRYDNHTLKLVSRVAGVWGTPTVIDASGTVDGYAAVAVGADAQKRIAYRRSDQGAQWYAGPEGIHTWTMEAVVQTGDVGRGLTVLQRSSTEYAVAYRNETQGALQFVRNLDGVWQTPLTVDPGPGRGTNLDITYRPGVGYAFSEYDAANGAALLADPVLHAPGWSIEPATASADNLGQQLKLLSTSDGGVIAAYKNATRGSLEYVKRLGGVWSAPVTVDPGPNRGNYFALAERFGAGLSFSEYDATNGAQLFLDPVLHSDPWVIHAATTSEDDLGRGLSLMMTPDGVMAAAFRDETLGALMHARYEGGAWGTPITVDPGNNRGSNCDLAYSPADGFMFSEYDGRNGAAMIAHKRIAARRWVASIVDPTPDAGAQASLFAGPEGRMECVYVARNTANVQSLRVVELIPGSAYVIQSVADSVGLAATGSITPDVSVTADHSWCISYRSPRTTHLHMASTAFFRVLPADAPEEQDGGTPVIEARLDGTFPNPARSGFRVRYAAPRPCGGIIEIYDPAGRRLRRIDLNCSAGNNEYLFDGRSASGATLAPGVYFLRMEVDGKSLGTRRIVLLDSGSTRR